jgi:hypothetical protein
MEEVKKRQNWLQGRFSDLHLQWDGHSRDSLTKQVKPASCFWRLQCTWLMLECTADSRLTAASAWLLPAASKCASWALLASITDCMRLDVTACVLLATCTPHGWWDGMLAACFPSNSPRESFKDPGGGKQLSRSVQSLEMHMPHCSLDA